MLISFLFIKSALGRDYVWDYQVTYGHCKTSAGEVPDGRSFEDTYPAACAQQCGYGDMCAGYNAALVQGTPSCTHYYTTDLHASSGPSNDPCTIKRFKHAGPTLCTKKDGGLPQAVAIANPETESQCAEWCWANPDCGGYNWPEESDHHHCHLWMEHPADLKEGAAGDNWMGETMCKIKYSQESHASVDPEVPCSSADCNGRGTASGNQPHCQCSCNRGFSGDSCELKQMWFEMILNGPKSVQQIIREALANLFTSPSGPYSDDADLGDIWTNEDGVQVTYECYDEQDRPYSCEYNDPQFEPEHAWYDGLAIWVGGLVYDRYPDTCAVMNDVCEGLRYSGNKITSKYMCGIESGEIAVACEVLLLGPEDPLADYCALVLGATFYYECNKAIELVGQFGYEQCMTAFDCTPIDQWTTKDGMQYSDALAEAGYQILDGRNGRRRSDSVSSDPRETYKLSYTIQVEDSKVEAMANLIASESFAAAVAQEAEQISGLPAGSVSTIVEPPLVAGQACTRSDCADRGNASGQQPSCSCSCDAGWTGEKCTDCTNLIWSQCGGANADGSPWTGATCCPSGTRCYQEHAWYSQCTPTCPTDTWDCAAGDAEESSESSEGPAECPNEAWVQCGGIGFQGYECCPDGHQCVFHNNNWSMCEPSN